LHEIFGFSESGKRNSIRETGDSIRRIDLPERASVGRARPCPPLTVADVAGRWNWVSIAAGILLACYLGLAIWALAEPSKYDPQQGMAIGFIIPVALVLGGLLLVLWRAVVRGRRWLVWTIFVLAAYPAVMWIAQFVYEHFFHTPR